MNTETKEMTSRIFDLLQEIEINQDYLIGMCNPIKIRRREKAIKRAKAELEKIRNEMSKT